MIEVRLSDSPAGDSVRTADGRTIAVSYSTDGAVHLVRFRYAPVR